MNLSSCHQLSTGCGCANSIGFRRSWGWNHIHWYRRKFQHQKAKANRHRCCWTHTECSWDQRWRWAWFDLGFKFIFDHIRTEDRCCQLVSWRHFQPNSSLSVCRSHPASRSYSSIGRFHSRKTEGDGHFRHLRLTVPTPFSGETRHYWQHRLSLQTGIRQFPTAKSTVELNRARFNEDCFHEQNCGYDD